MVHLTVDRLLAIVDVARMIRDRKASQALAKRGVSLAQIALISLLPGAFPSLVAEALELLTGSIKIW
jgi:hypothetical protein